jgi:hypothetical protein
VFFMLTGIRISSLLPLSPDFPAYSTSAIRQSLCGLFVEIADLFTSLCRFRLPRSSLRTFRQFELAVVAAMTDCFPSIARRCEVSAGVRCALPVE